MDRDEFRRLAGELRASDPEGWFDTLYRMAAGDPAAVPWADLQPNPNLMGWGGLETLEPGAAACVVGCGLGDDAEELAGRGLQVTAFDISPTAIAWCRRRFPDSPVDYRAADLLAIPDEWRGAFDFVFEAYTVQPMLPESQAEALRAVGSLVARGGRLLVVTRGRDDGSPADGLPSPISRSELAAVGLPEVAFEDYIDELERTGPARRFRVEFRRPNVGDP